MKKDKINNSQMRVLNIDINKNHNMFNKIDNWCMLSKNLYNEGMYLIKNYYIGSSKIHNNENINENCSNVIKAIDSWLDNYNNIIVPSNIEKKK